ncbi:MAG: eukaryotic-like serine/threonine-protein kinase [Acidobacteriota bacterium]|nr:eukaryotic-like serine/threonine-protein kinase [Acidobacteriota bacterium]
MLTKMHERSHLPADEPALVFGPFRLEIADATLWHGSQSLPLTPKAFSVLQCLVERRGRLVTKDELYNAVWPGVFVGDAVLKVCVLEVRRVLADDAKAPRYIETVHRRGYRFIAPVTEAPESRRDGRPDLAAAAAPLQAPPAADAPAVLDTFQPPETHYARSGDVNIAYQVVGDGPLDLVFVMGWVSHLEYFWQEPSFARFLRRLASFSRLILFDKRGTGLSDRVTALPTLEERMDDVRAVMEAVGSERAALLGISEGGPMCSLFAATYPEKTSALVMIGTYAKRVWDPDYPWAPTLETRGLFFDEIREQWGGPVGLEERAPSVAADPAFRAWWSTYLRMGASPGAALRLTQMNADINVLSVLPLIRVPTLILHRTDDRCLRVEEGRYMAGMIPDARFVELPGEDHLPFVGDQDAMLDEIEQCLTGSSRSLELDRVLATVMCVCASATADEGSGAVSPGPIERFYTHARKELEWFRGGGFAAHPAGFISTFDGPARAIRCASALSAAAPRFGVDVRIGLHTGECDVRNDKISGVAVDTAAQVAGHAAPSEVLVSRTVKDLVAGSGLRFEDHGKHALDGVTGGWRLYAVERGVQPRS